MKQFRFRFLVLASLLVSGFSINEAFASDHIDGKVTAGDAVKDISDLFIFKTPGDDSSLSLVLDARPFALSWNHFDTKVVYKIHLRKAHLNFANRSIDTEANSEILLTCSFNSPDSSTLIQATCSSSNGLKAVAKFNSLAPADQTGNSFKLYAGFRADPFFINKDFFQVYTDKLQIDEKTNSNIMTQMNVLTLVMDIPLSALFESMNASAKSQAKPVVSKTESSAKRSTASAGDYVIAAVAESRSIDPDQGWDVVGRPEITNLTMHARTGMADVRDSFNKLGAFRSPSALPPYIQRIHDNIKTYDMIDGRQDYTEDQLTSLATLLANDYVVIDPFAANCSKSSYFELERAVLLNHAPSGCGGRDMNDSVVNFLYTLYTKGLNPTSQVSDRVNAPEKEISLKFPYLAEPTTGPGAYIKATAARLLPP